jgi:hypothetical protein
MLHDYHFKLNEDTKLELIKISEDMNLSLSATIVVLFEKFIPFIDKHHLNSKEKNSKYQFIGDSKEKRLSIHCYMPENLYNRMKQLHHDLNYFSLAQVLRKMIDNFIAGCIKYGINNLINNLNKIIDIWNEKKEFYKKERTIFIRQLYKKNFISENILISYDIYSRLYKIQYI